MAENFWTLVRSQHPPFFRAVAEDVRVSMAFRGEPRPRLTPLRAAWHAVRLAWVSDAFLAMIFYRAKARLQAYGVPILPRIFHRLAMMHAQVCIGDPVIVEAGVYVAHGQVVIDGVTRIGSGCVISPWVTVGLKAGNYQGPTIAGGCHLGTGAKIIGPVTLGPHAVVGANSVVTKDVPPNTTVAGVPARPVPRRASGEAEP